MGYLDALDALLKKCRTKCRQSGNDPTLVPMWKERGARVCLIIASQLVEMKVRFNFFCGNQQLILVSPLFHRK